MSIAPVARLRSAALCSTLLVFVGAATLTPPARAQDVAPEVLDILSAVVEVQAIVPPSARTAGSLGTERLGSGVVIDAEGLIVTIGYLVLEASRVAVVTAEGKTVPATIVAYDHDTGFGLLRATEALNVKPMRLGVSADVTQWDQLLITAFGGPGVVRPAVAVSRRQFAGYWEYLLDDAIFTSPPYPMFGGAALLNSDGALVGIGSLVVGDAVRGERTLPGNMFVPIDGLKSVMAELLTQGKSAPTSRPWIGLYSQQTTDGRLVVQRVAEDGPAARAGIRAGDVIAELDGEPVRTLAAMYTRLWDNRRVGDGVNITVLRGTQLQGFEVTTGNRYDWLKLDSRD